MMLSAFVIFMGKDYHPKPNGRLLAKEDLKSVFIHGETN
jgi:hypothetical protein